MFTQETDYTVAVYTLDEAAFAAGQAADSKYTMDTLWGYSKSGPSKDKYGSLVKVASVSIVKNEKELCAALALAKKYETKILIEDLIVGREFSVGILNGRALPAIEIRPRDGFYDYERKYQSGMTEEICPAELSDDDAARLAQTALKAHRALGLGSYSRIDFIREEASGKFICLEANTLPGMTPMSLLPQEAAAAGIGYDELCLTIASTAAGIAAR
jgi:D-alanine-D-alanine ligase